MRFTKILSTALLSALLATPIFSKFIQVARVDDEIDLYKPHQRGIRTQTPPPEIDYNTISKWCSKPWTNSKRDVEWSNLKIRARPDNAREVRPGHGRGAGPTDGPLWSDQFGTCVGVVVTGTPNQPTARSRNLFHILLDNRLQDQVNNILGIISDLSNVSIWLYTVDTRCENPEFQENGNEELADDSMESEEGYKWIYDSLSVSAPVWRHYHPWRKPGEITVDITGFPVFEPNTT